MMVVLVVLSEAGLYVTAFLSVQSAARAGAMRNSGGPESAADQASACALALSELDGLPGLTSGSDCSSAPLEVTSTYCTAASGCAAGRPTADGYAATLVTVRYTVPDIFQVPFVGPSTISASSEMRIRSYE